MRHHNKIRTLSRVTKQRKWLLRSLAESLIKHGKIKTTEAKAKELRPFVERLVTYGKKGTLAGVRSIAAIVGPDETKKVTSELAEKYKDRTGGYTRITKAPVRKSDSSRQAYIEFV